jgi:hypothetical protein
MRSIVDDYAVIFMSAWNMTKLTSEEVSRRENIRFRQQYWIRDWVPMLDSLFERFVGSVNKETHDSSFNALTLVGDAIGKEFHRINDKECGEMKATFMSFESRVPGRVRLSDFYNKSTVSKWAFREKIGYLRALGALDETNTSNPMVIFTNYITSMPQCAPVSSFYSVCCPSECEDLMGKIEARIVAPGADPDHVAKVVSGVGSPTVPAPRKLSVSMLNRLHEIAALHGGWVPLHGRLFAQWMHHAFPRECPYPHRAASVSPLTADEWMRETGDADATFSTEEMREHIRPDETCPSTGCNVQETDSLPWDSLEELHQVSSPNSFAEGAVSDISIDQEGSPLIHRDMRLMGPNSNDINRGEAELERLLRDSKRMNVDAEAQESGGFHGAVFRAVLGGLFAASAAVVMRRWSRGHGEQKLPYSVSPEDRFV